MDISNLLKEYTINHHGVAYYGGTDEDFNEAFDKSEAQLKALGYTIKTKSCPYSSVTSIWKGGTCLYTISSQECGYRDLINKKDVSFDFEAYINQRSDV